MTALADKIAQFRKMATDDPDNELGHFRLGQLLLEDGQAADAVGEFRRTVELSPEFSKAHQLLGEALIKTGRTDEAVAALTGGWAMADGRGDKMPRDAMGKLLTELGAPIPVPAAPAAATDDDGPDTGFPLRAAGLPVRQAGAAAGQVAAGGRNRCADSGTRLRRLLGGVVQGL